MGLFMIVLEKCLYQPPTYATDQGPSTEAVGPQQRRGLFGHALHRHISIRVLLTARTTTMISAWDLRAPLASLSRTPLI